MKKPTLYEITQMRGYLNLLEDRLKEFIKYQENIIKSLKETEGLTKMQEPLVRKLTLIHYIDNLLPF